MTSAKEANEATRALREVLEDGEFTYNSKVESRLADVEAAIANMTTRDLTDEEADAWAMRTIPAPAAHYYRRAIAAALLASNRGEIPSEVRPRPSAAAVGPFGQARGERVAPLESVHLDKETYEARRAAIERGTFANPATNSKAERSEAFAGVTANHADGSQISVDLSSSPVPLHANDRIVVTRFPDGNVPLSITIGGEPEKLVDERGSVAGDTTDDEARSWERSANDWFSRGRAAAFREMLDTALSGIGREPTPGDRESAMRRIGQLESERSDVVSALRRICEKHGDNDWKDNYHLADVLRRNLEPWLNAHVERERDFPKPAPSEDGGVPGTIPDSLRVFHFRGYACICPRAANVCAIDIAAGTLWNDSAEPRRYFIAVVGYEGTEAAEHFTADPPGASVFSKWEDWYSEVLHRAAAEYQREALEEGRKVFESHMGGSLEDSERADALTAATWSISYSFKCGELVPGPVRGPIMEYVNKARVDIESRLTGLPGKVPE